MKGIVGFGFFLLFLAGIAFVTLQGRQMAQQNTKVSLYDTQWRPVSVNGNTIPEDAGMFVNFAADGSINGHAGCNRFFGRLETTESGLTIGPLGSTRMACPEPIMQREMIFLEAIQKMSSYESGNGELRILDSNGASLARLRADNSSE